MQRRSRTVKRMRVTHLEFDLQFFQHGFDLRLMTKRESKILQCQSFACKDIP